MAKLVVPKHLLERVVRESTSSGMERVYLGLGYFDQVAGYVEELVECPNVSEDPKTRFVAEPLCVYNVYKLAEERGLNVILLVHSHPAPPTPSFEDIKGMEYAGQMVWLIVSSMSGEFRAWMLAGGRLVEVEVITS